MKNNNHTNSKCPLCSQLIVCDIDAINGVYENENFTVTINMLEIFDRIKLLETDNKRLSRTLAEREFRY